LCAVWKPGLVRSYELTQPIHDSLRAHATSLGAFQVQVLADCCSSILYFAQSVRVQEVSFLVVDDAITAQNVSREGAERDLDVRNHVWVAGHEWSYCESRDLAKVFDEEVRLVGDDVRTLRQCDLLAMEDGHCIWANAPFEGDPGGSQQERLVWARVHDGLVPRHLCAYELGAIVNEGEECAIALQRVCAMLNESIQRNVGTGDWVGWRSLCDVEGERGGREVAR
jgi:hypothetical protein